MKKILVIETNQFIIPHFAQMGAFCTGKIIENNTDKGWLSLNQWGGESESADYYDTMPYMMPGIGSFPITHELCTPFIPLVSPAFYSNGYGSVFSISDPIKDVREKTQKAIADLFRRKILIAQKQHQGRKVFKKIKAEKREKYNSKIKQYPAFTNLGILWSIEPNEKEQNAILNRAKIYAADNNFEILNMFLIDFRPEYVNVLHKTI